jgi:cytochrome c-type biogenesis protein CcmH/NrfG
MNRIARFWTLTGLLAASAGAQTSETSRAAPRDRLKTGIAQFDAEQLERAKATLMPLAKAGDAEAMFYLGRIAIEQTNGDSAVIWLEEAVRKNGRSSTYHQWLGTAYSVKGTGANPIVQMSLAVSLKRAMERAVELDSTNIDARVNLMHFYLEAPAAMGGGLDKAREQAAIVMTRNPYQGALQNAAIAERQKDSVVAERTLRELSAAFPDSSAPPARLAIHYVTAKRFGDAFRVLDDRLRRSPDDGVALYQLGRVGAVSGQQLDRAGRALRRYVQLPHKRGTPSIAAAQWRIGMIHEAKGERDAAQLAYELALRLDPKLAGAKASLDKLKR